MIKHENDHVPARVARAESINLLVLLFSGAALIGIAIGGLFVDSWVGLIGWVATAEWTALAIIGIVYAIRVYREGNRG